MFSINATDAAREVFGRFATEEVETTYTINTAVSGVGKRVLELIIRGRMRRAAGLDRQAFRQLF